ncbi:NADP oxidoreductase [bacterium]|jgi:ferredoxin/flavodoxin---NADP+ reductase|nr:NADP oxidoreductase [bacterium]
MNDHTHNSPYKIAIIGAGPSGFYVVDSLLKLNIPLEIFMFEKLPTPYGLLRGGVAPDHFKMKNLESYFEKIAFKSQSFHFIGNCEIGKDIEISTIRSYVDATFITTGANFSRNLNIPGENLKNSHTAASFVAWYNGHPDFVNESFDLSGHSAVIIGQGNVALDIARILAKTPEELSNSEIPEPILNQLKKSKIKTIHIVGRRGPAQSKFTPNEFNEFSELKNAKVIVNPTDLTIEKNVIEYLTNSNNKKNLKNIELLKKCSLTSNEEIPPQTKTINIHFHLSPLEFNGPEDISSIEFSVNKMTGPANDRRAVLTSKKETIPTDIVFRSIGYLGSKIESIPFDDKKGIIPNVLGRVINNQGEIEKGMYVAGWIKRGPSGVIGSNKRCASESVTAFSEDINKLEGPKNIGLKAFINSTIKQKVSFNDWKKLDSHEKLEGSKKGKPREKFISVQNMLKFLEII